MNQFRRGFMKILTTSLSVLISTICISLVSGAPLDIKGNLTPQSGTGTLGSCIIEISSVSIADTISGGGAFQLTGNVSVQYAIRNDGFKFINGSLHFLCLIKQQFNTHYTISRENNFCKAKKNLGHLVHTVSIPCPNSLIQLPVFPQESILFN